MEEHPAMYRMGLGGDRRRMKQPQIPHFKNPAHGPMKTRSRPTLYHSRRPKLYRSDKSGNAAKSIVPQTGKLINKAIAGDLFVLNLVGGR